jgi:hypothetical protein
LIDCFPPPSSSQSFISVRFYGTYVELSSLRAQESSSEKNFNICHHYQLTTLVGEGIVGANQRNDTSHWPVAAAKVDLPLVGLPDSSKFESRKTKAAQQHCTRHSIRDANQYLFEFVTLLSGSISPLFVH